jgi:hypothetical protein
MNWRTSVKARHFVSALHDHFIDLFSHADLPFGTRLVAQQAAVSTTGAASESAENRSSSPTKSDSDTRSSADDRWCLRYMTLEHVPAIMEAFDDDASGYVQLPSYVMCGSRLCALTLYCGPVRSKLRR